MRIIFVAMRLGNRIGQNGDLDGDDIPGALDRLWDPFRGTPFTTQRRVIGLACLLIISDTGGLLHELQVHWLSGEYDLK
jgi:hypothetical protein